MRSGILHQAGVPGGRLFGVERHLILGHFDCRVPHGCRRAVAAAPPALPTGQMKDAASPNRLDGRQFLALQLLLKKTHISCPGTSDAH